VVRGTVSGTVADPQGHGVQWALVTLKESPRGAMTDPQGHFSINNVPVGIYTLRVSIIGFARATRDTVRVEEGRTTTVDVPLQFQAIKVHIND
jgi:iron complex outermembrane receptor protein